eukprot:TRINITY_DN12354_c0_g1_i5.p1 TRINITY_DN12354_c0_g1~~TRINITY_DN12354_c0_g1_i5.p1  ORF type:complete len:240 (+),score=54.61 TRINITY_DN12354_c0_g1_i5:103-822(+)
MAKELDMKLKCQMQKVRPLRSAVAVENKLINYQKKSKEVREKLALEQLIREVSTLKQKPSITERSRMLMTMKNYSPIYTHKRMLQINRDKRKSFDRIAKAISKEREPQAGDVLSSIPKLNTSFCPRSCTDASFSSGRVSSRRAATPLASRVAREYTTEERDAFYNCTFRPATNKKSQEMFARRNVRKKPVVERLLDYKKYKELIQKERMVESRPCFTPNLRKYTSAKVSFCLMGVDKER